MPLPLVLKNVVIPSETNFNGASNVRTADVILDTIGVLNLPSAPLTTIGFPSAPNPNTFNMLVFSPLNLSSI